MTTVTTRHLTSEPAHRVWDILLDCAAFPSYMDEVVSVEVVRDDGTARTSRWIVRLKGSELEWEEDEVIDHASRRIEFNQTEGDLAYFTGHWQVTGDGEVTTVELHVEFDIGIPLLADMLNPVAARALEDNSRAILDQLSRRAARTGMHA